MPARELFDRFFPKSAPQPEQLVIDHAGASLPVTFLRSARARRASLRVDPAYRRIVLTAPTRMARRVGPRVSPVPKAPPSTPSDKAA